MSGGPQDASIAGDGFRWYSWKDPITGEETRVLSVTSIRKLCGESFQLVAWQLANLANAATGMTKRVTIGPRGGRNEKYVRDGDGLGEFVRRVQSAKTDEALAAARAWLMAAAERPRDTAAIRGTIVHESIELNIATDRIDEAYVASAVDRLSQRDRAKVAKHGGITDDDVAFVRQCNAQFWDIRTSVPFVILAREPQVFNLTAGYGGSADVLLWVLGDWDAAGNFVPLPGIGPAELKLMQKAADRGEVTQEHIANIGGHVALGDWKTSKGIWTDNVIQVTAYQAAEFVGSNGLRDERLTAILNATTKAALVHIRPDGWTIHFTNFEANVLLAFLGSVALARFLATYQTPEALFTHSVSGKAVIAAAEEAAA